MRPLPLVWRRRDAAPDRHSRGRFATCQGEKSAGRHPDIGHAGV